jgi:hypothetical protein
MRELFIIVVCVLIMGNIGAQETHESAVSTDNQITIEKIFKNRLFLSQIG